MRADFVHAEEVIGQGQEFRSDGALPVFLEEGSALRAEVIVGIQHVSAGGTFSYGLIPQRIHLSKGSDLKANFVQTLSGNAENWSRVIFLLPMILDKSEKLHAHCRKRSKHKSETRKISFYF